MTGSFRHLTGDDGRREPRRHWCHSVQCTVVTIQAGDCYVTSREEVVSTVLGSCIAACIRDPALKLGGMNHFMLPTAEAVRGDADYPMRYGTFAMEHLINEILRRGGRRASLEVKLFGGASVLPGFSDIGRLNIEFAREFLAREGLTVVSQDLGDTVPRRIRYFPQTGRAMVRRLQSVAGQVGRREQAHMRSVNAADAGPATEDIELF